MNHCDIMKRINDNDMAHFPPKTDHPNKAWKDFDRRHGNRRFEAIFSVKKTIQVIRKLFGKGES